MKNKWINNNKLCVFLNFVVFYLFFHGLSTDVCQGSISPNSLQIFSKSTQILPLQMFSNLTLEKISIAGHSPRTIDHSALIAYGLADLRANSTAEQMRTAMYPSTHCSGPVSEIITIIWKLCSLPPVGLISKAKAIVKLRAYIPFEARCSRSIKLNWDKATEQAKRIKTIPLLPLPNFALPSLDSLPNFRYLSQCIGWSTFETSWFPQPLIAWP